MGYADNRAYAVNQLLRIWAPYHTKVPIKQKELRGTNIDKSGVPYNYTHKESVASLIGLYKDHGAVS